MVGHALFANEQRQGHVTIPLPGAVAFPTWRSRWTWPAELLLEDREEAFAALRRTESSGRPVGAAEFVTGLERLLGRPVRAALPGRDLQPESPPSDWIWCDRCAVDLSPRLIVLSLIHI